MSIYCSSCGRERTMHDDGGGVMAAWLLANDQGGGGWSISSALNRRRQLRAPWPCRCGSSDCESA